MSKNLPKHFPGLTVLEDTIAEGLDKLSKTNSNPVHGCLWFFVKVFLQAFAMMIILVIIGYYIVKFIMAL